MLSVRPTIRAEFLPLRSVSHIRVSNLLLLLILFLSLALYCAIVHRTLVKELVDTEEDFARDMAYVVNNYLKEMDSSAMPKRLREFKEHLFYNFADICDFHNEYVNTL